MISVSNLALQLNYMLHFALILLSNRIFLIGLIAHQGWALVLTFWLSVLSDVQDGSGGLKGRGRSYKPSKGAEVESSRFRAIWLIQVIGSDKRNWGQGWWGCLDCSEDMPGNCRGSVLLSAGAAPPRGKRRRDCLTAYLISAPAGLIIFCLSEQSWDQNVTWK